MLLNNSLCTSLPGCRLFPVLPGNGRITQDDLVLGGYLIPKGVRLMETKQIWILKSVDVLRKKELPCQSAKKYYSGLLRDPVLLTSLTDASTIAQLFSLRNWRFIIIIFILLDSTGSVSLLNIFGRWEFPWGFRLPAQSLDKETFHRSCRQLWLHSFWLRHQELYRQKNSRVRDASSSHKGRVLVIPHTLKCFL